MARLTGNGNGNGDSSSTTDAPPSNLLDPTLLLQTLQAIKKGDFAVRLPVDRTGIAGKIYDALNDVAELNKQLKRINNAVGKEGRINQRASLGTAGGGWAESVDSVNGLIADLVQPTA